MRRHPTVIAIGVALVLAAAILVASGSRLDTGDAGTPRATSPSALPPERPNTGLSPQSGMVDTAAAAESIPVLERAFGANPDSVRVALRLGDAYFAAQRYDDAAEVYGEALALSPGDPSATVRMAMVWHVRGDDDRALRTIERVIAAVPGQQEAHFDLAIIRFSRGESAAARESWARAAAIDPTSRLGRAAQNFVDLLTDGAAATPAP